MTRLFPNGRPSLASHNRCGRALEELAKVVGSRGWMAGDPLASSATVIASSPAAPASPIRRDGYAFAP